MTSRIYRDILALAADPVPGCTVYLPYSDDGDLRLDSWYLELPLRMDDHGNEVLKIPFQLTFPGRYPQLAPRLWCLCPSIRHPSIIDSPNGREVCLAMFEAMRGDEGRAGASKAPYSGWSASFSGYSVVMQLQGFFYMSAVEEEDYSKKQLQDLRAEVASFQKDILPTLAVVEQLPLRRKLEPATAAVVYNPKIQAPKKDDTPPAEADSDGFIKWTSKRSVRASTRQVASPSSVAASAVGRYMCSSCLHMKDASEFPASQLSKSGGVLECTFCKSMSDREAKQSSGTSQATTTSHSASTQLTKAQLRNKRRAEKRREKHGGVESASARAHGVSEAASVSVPSTAAVEEKEETPEVSYVSFRDFILRSLPSDMLVVSPQPLQSKHVPMVDARSVRNAGPLGRLSNQLIQRMLLHLRPADVINLTKTCQLLSKIGADGYIWREMVRLFYPDCRLWSESPQGWRSIFYLQANAVHESDLQCWQTKRSYKEDVLGIMLKFTINPVTKKTDYIYSDMHLISRTAYMNSDTTSIWGEKFHRWLPVFIDQEHFRRGLSSIISTITSLGTGEGYSTSFSPPMVLEVLPRLMNTIIVLLADEATSNDQTIQLLKGYFMIHRLFIALVQTYPSLRAAIQGKLRAFIAQEKHREKHACPSLGEFIALLSVSEDIGWREIGPVLFEEITHRSVLWVCRDVPKMATHRKHLDTPDLEFLQKVFDAQKVSHRLNMFHVCFLRMLGSPHGMPTSRLAAMYDRLLGMPSRHLLARLTREFDRIKAVSSWRDFFAAMCLPVLGPVQLSNYLADAVNASLRKRYHSVTTDFSMIQRSGVSNILLRGKSYPYSCFVIDISGSMADTFLDPKTGEYCSRLDYVKRHLHDVLSNHLTHREKFNIIFFESEVQSWGRGLVQATAENLTAAKRFIDGVEPRGGTNMDDALELAYSYPDIAAVYLLSDGEPNVNHQRPEYLVNKVARYSKNKSIPCHTTAFMANEHAKALMSRIAEVSGGVFLSVDEQSLSSS